MEEIWKDIVGYENLYQVSNLGNVRSLDRIVKGRNNSDRLIKGKMLKAKKGNNPYLFVNLTVNNKGNNKLIHRLVATAFIPNPNNYPQVNHLNENVNDNRANNLEWVLPRENANYGTRNQRISQIKSKSVLQFDLNGNLIAEYESQTQAAKLNNCYQYAISYCCLGKWKTYKGYIWKYKN